jgi:hypothetical protein
MCASWPLSCAGGYGWWKTRHARPAPADTLLANVKVVAAGCMEACLAGPALLVVPDNVWYGGVTEADVLPWSSST